MVVLERKKDALIAKGDHAGVIEVCNTLLQIEPRSQDRPRRPRGTRSQALGRVEDALVV
jgi:hypothetical protein